MTAFYLEREQGLGVGPERTGDQVGETLNGGLGSVSAKRAIKNQPTNGSVNQSSKNRNVVCAILSWVDSDGRPLIPPSRRHAGKSAILTSTGEFRVLEFFFFSMKESADFKVRPH